jgi:phosphatidylinositol kinase/protein kinase (PI-3  family)
MKYNFVSILFFYSILFINGKPDFDDSHSASFNAELKSSKNVRNSRNAEIIWKSDWSSSKFDTKTLPRDAREWIDTTRTVYYLFSNTLHVAFGRKMIGYINRSGGHCPNSLWNGVNTGMY